MLVTGFLSPTFVINIDLRIHNNQIYMLRKNCINFDKENDMTKIQMTEIKTLPRQ